MYPKIKEYRCTCRHRYRLFYLGKQQILETSQLTSIFYLLSYAVALKVLHIELFFKFMPKFSCFANKFSLFKVQSVTDCLFNYATQKNQSTLLEQLFYEVC